VKSELYGVELNIEMINLLRWWVRILDTVSFSWLLTLKLTWNIRIKLKITF